MRTREWFALFQKTGELKSLKHGQRSPLTHSGCPRRYSALDRNQRALEGSGQWCRVWAASLLFELGFFHTFIHAPCTPPKGFAGLGGIIRDCGQASCWKGNKYQRWRPGCWTDSLMTTSIQSHLLKTIRHGKLQESLGNGFPEWSLCRQTR